ncbi:MAG TPA: hypothetical protein VK633_06700 [Verrucomicrobiae bacterium]|nr:hypothetical protein [Verrucomicrobiae bacterium]
MKTDNVDPEDDFARLTQEATNQSTPDKALSEKAARPAPKKKTTKPVSLKGK